jgi:RNA polymerase sigma-70 factor (ECF subfamily)
VSAADEVEWVARLSWVRLVAILPARSGSPSDAKDALSGALVRALEFWPRQGIPGRLQG